MRIPSRSERGGQARRAEGQRLARRDRGHGRNTGPLSNRVIFFVLMTDPGPRAASRCRRPENRASHATTSTARSSGYIIRETRPDVTAALRIFLSRSDPGASGAVALGTQSLDAAPEFSERTALGFGDFRQRRLIANSGQSRVDLPSPEPFRDRRSLLGGPRLEDARRRR